MAIEARGGYVARYMGDGVPACSGFPATRPRARTTPSALLDEAG